MIDDTSVYDDPKGVEAKRDDEPSAALDEQALFARLKRWYRQDKQQHDTWKRQAAECYDMVAGEQWTSEDKSTMREQMRPIISFNRIGPVIKAVSGTEIGNRQEVRYLPRQAGDAMPDELLTNAAKWFREQCDGEDEESDAFIDTLVSGVGWTETRLDYEIDEEGAPLIDRVDPFEMIPDSASRKRNFEDARRVFRVMRIPMDEAKAFVGEDVDPDEIDAKWADTDDRGQPSETRQEARFYRPTPSDKDGSLNSLDDLVTLVEAQWWERVPAMAMPDPTQGGKITVMTEAEYAKATQRLSEMGVDGSLLKAVPTTKRVYYRAFLGKTILTKKDKMASPFGTHFSYKAITGVRDRNQGNYYGLVRDMMDPQRYANKWLSQFLHILNSSAKASPLVERGVFSDIREAEANWARPDKFIEVEQGALSSPNGPKIQPKPTSQLPNGYTDLMQFAITSIRDASGVNLELLGMKEQDQAGVLEAQRKKQAMSVLASFFDSLRRYRKSQGRLMLFIIQEYLSDGRLIRITGEIGQQYIPLIRDKTWGTYDVIVDDAPSSPQQKDQTWAAMQPLLPLFKDQIAQNPQLASILLENAPLPASVVEKFKQVMAQTAQGAQQQQQEMHEIAKAGAVAKVNKEQTSAELNRAKAAMHLKDTHRSHVEMHGGTADQMAAQQQAMQPEQAPPEQQAADPAMVKQLIELQMKQEEAQAKRQQEREDAEFKRQLELDRHQREMALMEQKTKAEVAKQRMSAKIASGKGKVSASDDGEDEPDPVATAVTDLGKLLLQQNAEQERRTAQMLDKLAEVMTAPKTVTTPDGRKYTAKVG